MSEDKKLSTTKATLSARDREIIKLAEARKARGTKPLLARAAMFAEVEKDEQNFHYHGFNDTGGQIKKAIDMGYEPVTDEYGNLVKECVGKANSIPCILMRIPMDLYKKRQAAKLKAAKDMEQSIKNKRVDEAVPVEHERVIDNT